MTKKGQKELTKLYFEKVPPGTSYHAGHVHGVLPELAHEYIKLGYAKPTTPVLPIDMPFRNQLIEAGIETMEDMNHLKSLTDIKGIGEKAAKEIIAFMKK